MLLKIFSDSIGHPGNIPVYDDKAGNNEYINTDKHNLHDGYND